VSAARNGDRANTRERSRTDLPNLQIIAFKFENNNIPWTYCSKNCSEIHDSLEKIKLFREESSKFQTPSSREAPSSKFQNRNQFVSTALLEPQNLELFWSLDAWDLELPRGLDAWCLELLKLLANQQFYLSFL